MEEYLMMMIGFLISLSRGIWQGGGGVGSPCQYSSLNTCDFPGGGDPDPVPPLWIGP